MSVKRMIRKELEKKLREHRKEASRLTKDLNYLNSVKDLVFYVFVGNGWREEDPKLHFKARGSLSNIMRAAIEEFKRVNGVSNVQSEYIRMVVAPMPSGNPVLIPQKFFIPYLKKYCKHS